MKTNYSELLRDPRWQKKRLEILSRDEFTCQSCFDSESTLNVHHCYYERGNDPWEYPNTALLTLCESCHERESHQFKGGQQALTKSLAKHRFLASDMQVLANAIDRAKFGYPAE